MVVVTGLCLSDNSNNIQGKTTRSYVPYDAKLKTAGQELPFILFVGEEIYKGLGDSEVRATISTKFKDLLEKEDCL